MVGLDATYYGAFVAGMLSFLSPCILPLVPPYLCFLGGVSLKQLEGGAAVDRAALHVAGRGIKSRFDRQSRRVSRDVDPRSRKANRSCRSVTP